MRRWLCDSEWVDGALMCRSRAGPAGEASRDYRAASVGSKAWDFAGTASRRRAFGNAITSALDRRHVRSGSPFCSAPTRPAVRAATTASPWLRTEPTRVVSHHCLVVRRACATCPVPWMPSTVAHHRRWADGLFSSSAIGESMEPEVHFGAGRRECFEAVWRGDRPRPRPTFEVERARNSRVPGRTGPARRLPCGASLVSPNWTWIDRVGCPPGHVRRPGSVRVHA